MLLSAQGKRSNPLLANLLAKPSTAGPASGGKGQPKRKAKAPPASDGPDPAPDGAPPSTPDRRAPPRHPNGTPIGIVVEKVVARSSFAKASRRSTAAGPTAGTRASKAPTHEGTLELVRGRVLGVKDSGQHVPVNALGGSTCGGARPVALCECGLWLRPLYEEVPAKLTFGAFSCQLL